MENEVKNKVLTVWDSLIEDAKQKIASAKERVAVLRKTLKNLERVRDSGQPWPGTQSQSQNSGQQHSV